ncbi:hypothetical protein L6R29_21865 [Myxococcota bacterium]|nr:hypothetical protein [Myxococcota bacterium]
MSVYRVHYKAMKALLGQSTIQTSEGCPFAPMLRGQMEDLTMYREALEGQGLLVGGGGLCEEAREALEVIARPTDCLAVTSFASGNRQRVTYFLREGRAVVAGFDHQETCNFSKPVLYGRLAENLARQLAGTKGGGAQRPFRMNPALLRVFAQWMDEGMRLQPPREASEAYRRSALSKQMILRQISEQVSSRSAEALCVALLELRLLVEEGALCWFGPEFSLWYEALSGDERVELQLRVLPLRDQVMPERGMIFVGEAGQRLMLWSQGEREVIWAFRAEEVLAQALLRDLLGCREVSDKEMLEGWMSRGVMLDVL